MSPSFSPSFSPCHPYVLKECSVYQWIDYNGSRVIDHIEWKRCHSYKDIQEIMSLVEPNDNDPPGTIDRYPDLCRAYQAYSTGQDKIVAIGIAVHLPMSNVFYIEDFALHPCIRGRKWARKLFREWRNFVFSDWPVMKLTDDRLMIEVYLKNIIPWNKIMGVQVSNTDLKPLWLSDHTPIKLMSRQVSNVDEVYNEYQEFQRRWMKDLSLCKKM